MKQTFGKYYHNRPRQNGDAAAASGVEIREIETEKTNGHVDLKRTKSSSSEDLAEKATKSIEDLEDLEQLRNWRRTSKIRRSLQFPKQNNSSLPSKAEDTETGRRLSTALRGNNVDLEALDQILQSISNSSSSSNVDEHLKGEEPERDEASTKKQKRNSFVTVESLREVKGRLRHTSGVNEKDEVEEPDDGIVTEDTNSKLSEMPAGENTKSRVRSYVYGMEAMLNKKPVLGTGTTLKHYTVIFVFTLWFCFTGSLESKSKQLNCNSTNRGDDWYNRRKSYGFEQVTGQQQDTIQSSRSKTHVDSSTDSGICRSTEIVVPSSNKNGVSDASSAESDEKSVKNDYTFGKVKKYSALFDNQKEPSHFTSKKAHEELTNIWSRRSSLEPGNRELEATTITIPIVSQNAPTFTDRTAVDDSWSNDLENENKRHSIAVDESKYVTKSPENKFRRTSLAVNDHYPEYNILGDGLDSKKPKKVEFCKTEVHFTAESGKVNIVETDEKPPPTHNFRRRRKNIGLITPEEFNNRSDLPVLHFGDTSYEKVLLGLKDLEQYDDKKLYENVPSVSCNSVTVNNNAYAQQEFEDDRKESLENETPRGILKNKPIKPRPYHLGDNEDAYRDVSNDTTETAFGVKLKPVHREESTPIWRSTVTVRNTFFDKPQENSEPSTEKSTETTQPEFQRMLKTLRPTQKGKEEHSLENFGGIRIVSPAMDARRSSWSVADRVKHVEDLQWTENKGYSTKVNFGDGEATVVENGNVSDNRRQTTWPRREDDHKGKAKRGIVD